MTIRTVRPESLAVKGLGDIQGWDCMVAGTQPLENTTPRTEITRAKDRRDRLRHAGEMTNAEWLLLAPMTCIRRLNRRRLGLAQRRARSWT
jgi:hypothetical protein